MSDDAGRRKFIEIIGGMFALSIIASLFSNDSGKPQEPVIAPTGNKLLDSAVLVSASFGFKYFSTTLKIGKEFINLFSPTVASADELPETNSTLLINNEQMVSLEDEMKQVVVYYNQKQYQEAINYLNSNNTIIESSNKDSVFKQLIETTISILSEFLWIENLKNNQSVEIVSSCENLSSMQKIINLNRMYLLEWYGKYNENESINKLDIFKHCYQNLQMVELTENEKLLQMLAVVYATLLFNYDFENNAELLTYDKAIVKAREELNTVTLPQDIQSDSIVMDQWNYLQCRLEVFDKMTSNRQKLQETITNLPTTIIDDGERNYLLASNALFADHLEEAEAYGNNIGIAMERYIIKLFIVYEKARRVDDRSPETRQKMKDAEALIEQNDPEIFNKLVINNQEMFEFINEEPSVNQNEFPEEKQSSGWSFF